jgi:Lamin Tail Domain/CotH kinase protein/Putative Ig domain/Bacterial TSP3 repeat
MNFRFRLLAAGLLAVPCFLPSLCAGAPVISEIMYRPGTAWPENTGLEFIEIHNPGTAAEDLSGWALTSGVSYTFPAGTILPAGGYVIAGANPAALNAVWSRAFLGPWSGTLANNGEKITLSRPGVVAGTWIEVDEVRYASEGNWGQRYRETAWNGWDWQSPASSGGKSVELRNAALSNDNGQNWLTSSAGAGGTPGAANTAASTNIPPIIHSVKHSPAVPLSTDAVTISCEVNDEAAPAERTATLYYRNVTTAPPPSFSSEPMSNDGRGKMTAVLPPATDKSIFEFYISSTDGAGPRTWPGLTTLGQTANCLYQVDNEPDPAGADIYRLVLTAADNAEWIGLSSGSDRQYNLTLIARRGSETVIRYRSAMRTRGNSSRSYQFRPLRISMPNDDDWDGVTVFNLNPKATYLQYTGMKLFQAAGLPAPDVFPVELRRNGLEQTTSSGSTPDYGRWVRMEDLGGDMVSRAWPLHPGGNIYKKVRPDEFWRSTGSAPASPSGSLDGWSKQNNSGANDWSDLRSFFTTYQNTAAPYFPGAPAGDAGNGTAWNNIAFSSEDLENIETVADLNQWARWFAVMTILQSNETNISNGQDDDYAAYFAPQANGRRLMQLLPHDLDTILGKGDNQSSRGLYDMTEESSVFTPLLPLIGDSTWPGNTDFRGRYHTALRQLFGTVFQADTGLSASPPFYQFIDAHLTGWVPDNIRTDLKSFMTARQASLLANVGNGAITPPPATATATLSSTHGPLMISEVLASNLSAHQNGVFYPDIIELHNAGGAPIDLGGKSLTDDPSRKDRFVFAAGTVIRAGGYLVMYADSDFAGQGLHTGFQLDQGGDAVYLYDTAGAGQGLIDSVVFGPQVSDRSIGRTGTGLNTWALCTLTADSANTAVTTFGAPGGLRINEWLGNADFRVEDDFVEIHNPAANPVPLGGMRLTDDFINYRSRHVLPPLSFIGAGGYQVFEARGNDATPGNPVELPFGIDSSAGWLALIGANNVTVDTVATVAHFRDASTGRSPDGGAALSVLALPSPGVSNAAPPTAYTALINGLRITELNYRPAGGNDYEFIELQNTGATPLPLTGVRFTSGIDYTFLPAAPLAPGAFMVICRNRTAFLSRFPAAASVLAEGTYTGALDNSGERLTLSLPAPWNVAILNFSYDTGWEPLTFTSGHSLTVFDPGGTAARDWSERETWIASPLPHGSPGSEGPPVINSALTLSGITGDSLSYQITATRFPSSYAATGLPAGLTVNTVTGRISGTPLVSGTFPITLSAENTAGSSTAVLQLTIAASGPLTHFTWDGIPSGAKVSAPAPVWITARDAKGRRVTSFEGTTALTATGTSGAASPSRVVITEFTDENEDQFELQNTGAEAVDTTGWFVVIGHSTAIDAVNSATWMLPASVPAGGLLRVTESPGQPDRAYFGSGISWTTAVARGWIMLLDADTNLRDFVAWGWPAADLEALSINVNGRAVNLSGQWSGAGAPAGARSGNSSWMRSGAADSNSALDWTFSSGVTSWGTTNAALTIPWSTPQQVTVLPEFIAYSGGVFTGYVTISPVANSVRVTANDGAGHTGTSAPFHVTAAVPDTDGDFMPDAWETAQGLNPALHDAAADADGDGFPNRAEYYAGTNPRSAASRLGIGSITRTSGGQVSLSWPVQAGSLYRIAGSDDLSTWAGEPGQVFLPAATGSQTAAFAPSLTRRYYRLELVLP